MGPRMSESDISRRTMSVAQSFVQTGARGAISGLNAPISTNIGAGGLGTVDGKFGLLPTR